MTDYAWRDERARAIELFGGETPRAQLEHDILEVFLEQPALVHHAIDQVGTQHAAGKVRSGWAVLRTHVTQAAAAKQDAIVTDTGERERKVARAEHWIRSVGIGYETEPHIEAELFGDDYGTGMLEQWATDDLLRRRLLDLWRSERPRQEAAETEATERWERFREQRDCPDCGHTRPFASRPCQTPECRRKAAAAVLLAARDKAMSEPTLEPDLAAPEPSLA